MTEEELINKLAEKDAQIKELADKMEKVDELDRRFNPVNNDPDLVYKPKTWKELDDRENAKAEAAAIKALEDAEKRKEEKRIEEEKNIEKQNKQIEDTFKKLEEAGVIEATKSLNDKGAHQRQQVLGALVSLGGQHIENAVEMAKSAWEVGAELSYNRDTNKITFVRSGNGPSQTRDALVTSSAKRLQQPTARGAINIVGIRGNLDEARRRWEEINK